MPNTLNIKERVRELRDRNNLNQTDFAKKIGAKRGNVAQWEAGNNYPSLEYLTQICEVFNVTADWLLLGIEEKLNKGVDEVVIDSPLQEISVSLKELVVLIKSIDTNLMNAAKGSRRSIGGTQPEGSPQTLHTGPDARKEEIELITPADRLAEETHNSLMTKKRGKKGG